jgi:hypothetical protein
MAAPQNLGALMVLAAFVLSQQDTSPPTPPYLLLNAAGADILTADAIRGHQWGFVPLEGTWCLVALRYLLQKALPALTTGPHPPDRRR